MSAPFMSAAMGMNLVSGVESIPDFPQKLDSSAEARPVWESVEPIMPTLNGLAPIFSWICMPRCRAERT